MPRRLNPARSANSSCDSPAANRYRFSSPRKDPGSLCIAAPLSSPLRVPVHLSVVARHCVQTACSLRLVRGSSRAKTERMTRTIVFTAFVSSAASAALTALLVLVMLPAVVDAQVARVIAQGLTVARSDGLPGMTADVQPAGGGLLQILGPDGKTQRVSLSAAEVRSSASLLDQNGTPRIMINIGGQNGTNSAAEGVNLDDPDGRELARIGTGDPGTRTVMRLSDQQENVRLQLAVGDDGTPSMQMFDTSGNVIWSAP
jgi:hypothetical protein